MQAAARQASLLDHPDGPWLPLCHPEMEVPQLMPVLVVAQQTPKLPMAPTAIVVVSGQHLPGSTRGGVVLPLQWSTAWRWVPLLCQQCCPTRW